MSPSFALVFPGQGSQKVGMLESFYTHKIFLETFVEASDCLGFDLLNLIRTGPQEALNKTEKTQPLLLSSSIALWRVWQSLSDRVPAAVAGHSLGEWSALVCADVLPFTDALKLVELRGRYMQDAVPVGQGGMAAIIGLEDGIVEKICAEAAPGEVCAAVNYNSPGQLVIAGNASAVEKAMEACKAAGARRALPLPVSAPFHTALMRPAAEKLEAEIASVTFSKPQIPVVHNVNAHFESDPANIKSIMVEQVYSPVRWVACVQKLVQFGTNIAIECGPGRVLSGLNSRIHKELVTASTDTDSRLQECLDILK